MYTPKESLNSYRVTFLFFFMFALLHDVGIFRIVYIYGTRKRKYIILFLYSKTEPRQIDGVIKNSFLKMLNKQVNTR